LAVPLSFSGPDLLLWLDDVKTRDLPIDYDEASIQFDRESGLYLGGIGYNGIGVLSSITTPEPRSGVLLAIAAFGALIFNALPLYRQTDKR
jgi:hypothetical protein